MSGAVLVVGASGRVGGELVKLLVESGETVRAATRNVSSHRFAGAVEVVNFDFDRPQSFAPALNGADRVFLVARPGDNHSDRVAMPFIDEARKQGVKLIVNLTAMGAEQDEAFMLRVLERYVETSGVPYVHLRPNWFMQNFDSGPIFAYIQASGAIHLPAGEARLSFIHVRDIASVGAECLTDPRHTGKAYTLTGGEPLSHSDVAEKISRAAHKAISYVPISEETARAGLSARGIPAEYIDRWANFFSKVRQGLCAQVSDDVVSILGRSPIAFDRYVEECAASWS
jgi:uncharacterized protein YbjT (DUF2867 family)